MHVLRKSRSIFNELYSRRKLQNNNDFRLLYLICSIAGSLYCAGLTFGTVVLQNIYTGFFVLFLISLFVFNLKKLEHEMKPHFIFYQLIILNLSIAITAHLLKTPDSFFWVTDSIVLHLPESIKFAKFFQGDFHSLQVATHHSGRVTHAVTGFFLAIFGINTFATIFALLMFKIFILILIYKSCTLLWSHKIAGIAILLYGLCPTIFFYNLILYKESAVQALTAAILFFSIQVFVNKKYFYLFPLIIIFILLTRERNYIAYICIPMFILLTSNLFLKFNFKNYLILAIALSLFVIIGYKYSPLDISSMFNELQRIRSTYQVFSDVINRYNYEIPYLVAFFKILFSPYFTFNKFIIFTNFGTLLIWGSLLNQLIILASILGFLKLASKKIIHLYLWIPFIIFLLFAAYISPWSGRLRDSFYPLIACYAAHYLYNNKHFKKIFHLN